MNLEKERLLLDKLGEGWFHLLKDEFEQDYMKKLSHGLKVARMNKTIYPAPENIFKALKLTPFNNVKVVWLGQDPYHNGSANGLAFDCSISGSLNPSMNKILKVYEKEYPNHFNVNLMDGKLEHWARQGVLLLNVSLTVPKGEPGKHIKHWEPFTTKILNLLLDDDRPKLFVCLGKWAKGIANHVYPPHGVAEYEHPAAACYAGRDWNAEGIFGKINDFLKKEGMTEIEW